MSSMKQILASGELEGWETSTVFDAINEQIVKDQDCKHCGHHGLYCVEYQRLGQQWAIRSFQVCPECQTAEEF
jgi:hypothetical protein